MTNTTNESMEERAGKLAYRLHLSSSLEAAGEYIAEFATAELTTQKARIQAAFKKEFEESDRCEDCAIQFTSALAILEQV